MKTIPIAQKEGKVPVSRACECFDMTRDAYYKYLKRQAKRDANASRVVELVKEERKDQPRVGTRKLYKALGTTFKANEIKIGRDCLFDILREENMLVKKKRAYAKTTNSYHHFHKYNNLIKHLGITTPNQVWVSDITYIRTVKGFCYLALITDLYSRKIVGYDISDTLELTGCLRALQKALKQARPKAGTIHHSDRGVQYCSHQYVDEMKKHKILISMTKENNCC